MSARDAIENLADCYMTPGVHKRMMTLVDLHAHELAEKIRAKAHDLYGIPDAAQPGQITGEYYGLLDAADLIDPEVTE